MPPTDQQLGYAFAPTFAGAEASRGQAATAQPAGAIKTLNFRLPQVTGSASANALSPLTTNNQPVGGFGGAVLQSVLRTILGSDAGSQFGSPAQAQAPSGSPFVPTRDYGSDFLQSVRSAPPPQTGPSDNVNVPQFEGLYDPPMPSGPAFDDGGYAPAFDNAWASLTSPDEDARRQYDEYLRSGGFQPWMPQRPPNPSVIVDTNPTGGGSFA